jgi:hypothetical protein
MNARYLPMRNKSQLYSTFQMFNQVTVGNMEQHIQTCQSPGTPSWKLSEKCTFRVGVTVGDGDVA